MAHKPALVLSSTYHLKRHSRSIAIERAVVRFRPHTPACTATPVCTTTTGINLYRDTPTLHRDMQIIFPRGLSDKIAYLQPCQTASSRLRSTGLVILRQRPVSTPSEYRRDGVSKRGMLTTVTCRCYYGPTTMQCSSHYRHAL